MSDAGGLAGARRDLMALLRRRPLYLIALALVAVVALLVSAVLYGDLPEFLRGDVPSLGRNMRELIAHYSYLPGFGLLYIEESGIPLPAPGDVFVMFVGIHIPHTVLAWVLAWLGLVTAVTLGATNLFLLSRRFGSRLVHSWIADYAHLTPERLDKAEAWFRRYGVLAIVFGRHIPGFRVPITVAAGTLGVSYRVFAPSVAVSTAIWAGVMLSLGVTIGPRLSVLLVAHSWIYLVWAAIIVAMVGGIYLRQRRAAKARARRASGRPVESPGS